MDTTEWKMRLMANAPPVPEWWAPLHLELFPHIDGESVEDLEKRAGDWHSKREAAHIYSWPKHYAEMVMRTLRA